MENIKRLREKAFLSQIELAYKAGLSKRTINRIERGLESPRFSTIRKLAEALGVEPGEIEFPSKRE